MASALADAVLQLQTDGNMDAVQREYDLHFSATVRALAALYTTFPKVVLEKLRTGALTSSKSEALTMLSRVLEYDEESDFGDVAVAVRVILDAMRSDIANYTLQASGLVLMETLINLHPDGALEAAAENGAVTHVLDLLKMRQIVNWCLQFLWIFANNARVDASSSAVTAALMEVANYLKDVFYTAEWSVYILTPTAKLFKALAMKAPSSVWAAADGLAMITFLLEKLIDRRGITAPMVLACVDAAAFICIRSAGNTARGLYTFSTLLQTNIHTLPWPVLAQGMITLNNLLKNDERDGHLLEYILAVMREYGRDGSDGDGRRYIVMHGMTILQSLENRGVRAGADELNALMRALLINAPVALLDLRRNRNSIVTNYFSSLGPASSSIDARLAGGGTSRRSRKSRKSRKSRRSQKTRRSRTSRRSRKSRKSRRSRRSRTSRHAKRH